MLGINIKTIIYLKYSIFNKSFKKMYYPFIKIGPFGMEPAAYIFVETLQNKIRAVEFYFMALKN